MATDSEQQFTIEVNGVEIKTTYEKLVAADVLLLAVKNHAISGTPEEYILESDDPPFEFKPDDWVDFTTYKTFTAERSAATPVALHRAHERSSSAS